MSLAGMKSRLIKYRERLARPGGEKNLPKQMTAADVDALEALIEELEAN